MRLAIFAFAAALAGCTQMPSGVAWMDGAAPAPINGAQSIEAAFIMGKPGEPGLYTIRVHMHEGGLMPPHTHPDTRQITVLSGDLWYGFGDKADPALAKLYPAGSWFIVPGGEPHFAIGKSDAVYQESGMAPTGTEWIK